MFGNGINLSSVTAPAGSVAFNGADNGLSLSAAGKVGLGDLVGIGADLLGARQINFQDRSLWFAKNQDDSDLRNYTKFTYGLIDVHLDEALDESERDLGRYRVEVTSNNSRVNVITGGNATLGNDASAAIRVNASGMGAGGGLSLVNYSGAHATLARVVMLEAVGADDLYIGSLTDATPISFMIDGAQIAQFQTSGKLVISPAMGTTDSLLITGNDVGGQGISFDYLSITFPNHASAIVNFPGSGNVRTNAGNLNLTTVGGNVVMSAGMSTGSPGSGSGVWKMGKIVAGAVALDNANYVEVAIDGTIVKLLKAS